MKVWWRKNTSNMNARQLYIKIHKKRNKIMGRFITCSHMWHINISVYVRWLDTYSLKVWWSYVLLNTNAFHFSVIAFNNIGEKSIVLDINGRGTSKKSSNHLPKHFFFKFSISTSGEKCILYTCFAAYQITRFFWSALKRKGWNLNSKNIKTRQHNT